MTKQWVVLGGWGVAPEILCSVFGKHAQYIDINTFASELLDGETLTTDWRQRCVEEIEPVFRKDKPRLLAGWSTGAMLALACTEPLSPDALILISATPSFCRTRGFRFGTRPSVLAAMRTRLATEPLLVVNDFLNQCGLRDERKTPFPWSGATLADGLQVLEQLTLLHEPVPSCPILQIHGKDDCIIPYAAGQQLQKQLSSHLLTLEAPHACFLTNETTIRNEMKTIFRGI